MCSPEEDVQRACARGADVSLRRACRLKVFFIPFQAFERAMARTCTGESGRNSTDFFQSRHFLAVENYSGRLVTVLVD